jgi:hypothetical protein
MVRQIFPPQTLKSQISSLLASSTLSSLGISIARDWKDHINFDDESEDLESIQEFLERIEREFLTETEGVKWRFEDVLEEWIGEWPDGREIGSSKIPRVRRILDIEEEEEWNDEEDDFGGSLVKRVVPRSGLVIETPIQSHGKEMVSERKAVLERLFKLTSIGQSAKGVRTKSLLSEEIDGGSSFLERLGQRPIQSRDKDESGYKRRVDKRRIVSDDETSISKNNDPKGSVIETSIHNRRKRRRFEESDDDSDISAYEDEEEDNDLENHSVESNSELDPSTSDIDELSISLPDPRHALQCLPINRKSTNLQPSSTRLKKMLVRESSPAFFDDESDDELAI